MIYQSGGINSLILNQCVINVVPHSNDLHLEIDRIAHSKWKNEIFKTRRLHWFHKSYANHRYYIFPLAFMVTAPFVETNVKHNWWRKKQQNLIFMHHSFIVCTTEISLSCRSCFVKSNTIVLLHGYPLVHFASLLSHKLLFVSWSFWSFFS
jgi:hypothetical protein